MNGAGQSLGLRGLLPGRGVIDLLAVLAMLAAWLGLAGNWYWLLDLFSHFRWQYLVVCLLSGAWAIWQQRWRTLVFAVLTLLLNVLLIGKLALPAEVGKEATASATPLRVISLNVLTSNPDRQRVLRYLMDADADIIFLMEVDAAWVSSLEPLQKIYPQQVLEPRDDNFGVALFSRLPLLEGRTPVLGRAGLPSIQARVVHQGRELVIIGTHTLPPMNSEWSRLRDEQLAALSRNVEDIEAPVLVLGDFNATPWSSGLRKATAGKLDYCQGGAPWRPTWKVRSIFAVPIDHALCTRPLRLVSSVIGPDVGSDHRPLQVTVGWNSSQQPAERE